jgi:polar amino acid transport system ATP-binding protein
MRMYPNQSSCAHNGHGHGLGLQLDGVSKSFGSRSVLNAISIGLEQRKVLALCGASGSGKTTLLRIICGLCTFENGQVAIGTVTISAGTVYPRNLYGRIGLVSQDPNLFPHLTAVENVALALREFKRLPRRHAHELAMIELERMGVAELAQQYPATLSGGEKQRVAIARAVAVEPLVLLLDEPTAHLDRSFAEEVCQRIIDLSEQGTTIVIVTHSVGLARDVAKTFAILRNGTCSCSDDPEILTAPHS